jgi:ComF family protein
LKSIDKIISFLLALLFPKRCLGCGVEGTYCCARCANVIEPRYEPRLTLPGCELDCLLAACVYKERSLVARLIHQYKYRFSEELAEFFVTYLAPLLQKYFEPHHIILVPVPLHPKRQRFRGFNQAELLCTTLSEQYDYQWVSALKRVRHTRPQAQLTRSERLANLNGAFRVIENVEHLSIVLVDDVATTGATLHACARALREAGCAYVYGLVIAHGGDGKR